MPNDFYIDLDSTSLNAGENVTGTVRLSTPNVYSARSIKIGFNGRASTNWNKTKVVYIPTSKQPVVKQSSRNTELVRKTVHNVKTKRREDNNNSYVKLANTAVAVCKVVNAVHRTVEYSASEQYIEEEKFLWVCQDESNQLDPGEHSWPFSFKIPSTAPPSFEGKHGSIKYSLTAEVDIPYWPDTSVTRNITVTPYVDLNSFPKAVNGASEQSYENIGFCWFSRGLVELKVDIPKTGYIQKQDLRMDLDIKNNSSLPVTLAHAELVQHSTYIARRHGSSKTRSSSKTVHSYTHYINVEPGEEYSMWLKIKVPCLAPTFNKSCSIISVWYRLCVSVSTTAWFNSSVECVLPIVIGTERVGTIPSAPEESPTPSPRTSRKRRGRR